MSWLDKLMFKQRTPTETPPTTEKASFNDDFFFQVGRFGTFNPDELIGFKGHEVYRKMLRDPQVKAAYDLLVSVIISREWRFVIRDDTPEQQEIKDFLEFNLEHSICGTFLQSLRGVMLAKAHGFSLTEKTYKVGEFEGREAWLLESLKPKDFSTFEFVHDKFGNVKEILQDQFGNKVRLDPRKFITYVNKPEFDPVWGESDLRSVYRAYWEKDIINKLWTIHLERVAGGFTVAQAKDSSVQLQPREKLDLEASLRNLTQMSAVRMPAGYELNVVHGPNTTAFEEAIAHRDRQITKGLLVPNLLGLGEQNGAGSFAQSQTHLDTFFFIVNEQGNYLADTLNEQLFSELVWWNFGTRDFPKFEFDGFTEAQKKDIAMAWNESVKGGIVVNTFKDEQKTRSLLGYEQREEDEQETTEPENGDDIVGSKHEPGLEPGLDDIDQLFENASIYTKERIESVLKLLEQSKDEDSKLKSMINKEIREYCSFCYDTGYATSRAWLWKRVKNKASYQKYIEHMSFSNKLDPDTGKEIDKSIAAVAFNMTGSICAEVGAAIMFKLRGVANNFYKRGRIALLQLNGVQEFISKEEKRLLKLQDLTWISKG